MIIQDVPKEFQPKYISTYPVYSSGKNIEEYFMIILQKKKRELIQITCICLYFGHHIMYYITIISILLL